MRDKLLLVLDLDEALIYATENKQELSHLQHDFFIQDEYTSFRVFKRPGVDKFLDVIFSHPNIEVGVWTSASPTYAKKIVENLFAGRELLFMFDSRRLVKEFSPATSMYGSQGIVYKKDLKKVVKHTKKSIERIVAIDDKPSFYTRSYGNLIAVPPFCGDKAADGDLIKNLTKYVLLMEKAENVRTIEKRYWQSTVGNRSESSLSR